MLYVLVMGFLLMFTIDFLTKKKKSINYYIFSLMLFLILNYLTYKNNFLNFEYFQILLMIVSYISALCFYNRKKKNKYLIVLFFLLCSFYCEFLIFNFRHFTTFLYKEQTINNYKIVTKEKAKNKTKTFIMVDNIHKNINNLYLDVKIKKSSIVFPVEVKGTDQGNKNLYSLGAHKYITSIPQSQYFYTHFYGKTKRIELDVSSFGENFKINKLIINKYVPLFFNYLRFLILFLLLYLFYMIRPNSSLYQYKLFDTIKYKKSLFAIYIIICAIFFSYLNNINPKIKSKIVDSHNEYYDLTESLLDGHFYLNAEVPKVLKEMKNPYDTKNRKKKFTENQLDKYYKWDYVYYNGKFYVYFGIVPVFIAFLPYYVLLNFHLPISKAIFIFLLFGICSILYFVYQICKKYFKKVGIVHYFLGVTTLIFTSGFVYIARRPDIYSIPIISSLSFTFLGLGLWIDASISEKHKKLKLFLGSLSIALTSGCRPQFLISSLFFYPILKDDLYENKKIKVKNIITFFVPFILIGCFIMFYNYARFGSIFDFGVNYNLTTNDMTHRGINLDRFGLGIFMYLFKPVNVISSFPYVGLNKLTTNYLGKTIYESFLGGFFWSTSIVFVGFYLLKHKKEFDKNILKIGIMCYVFATIIILFDTQMAGILPRYICDFAWLFLLPTLFVLFHFDGIRDEEKKKKFRKIYLSLLLISLLYQFCIIFKYIDLSLEQYSPKIFHSVRYFIEFWL